MNDADRLRALSNAHNDALYQAQETSPQAEYDTLVAQMQDYAENDGWECYYTDVLHGNVWQLLERNGFTVERMSAGSAYRYKISWKREE